MDSVLKTWLDCFNSKEPISVLFQEVAIAQHSKYFYCPSVFNLICMNYANYNVTTDRIITKEMDQARTFLFFNLAVFIVFFPFILICVCASVENR